MEGSLGPWRALERESGAEKWPGGDGEGSRLGTGRGAQEGKALRGVAEWALG